MRRHGNPGRDDPGNPANLDRPRRPSYRTNVSHDCFADEVAIDFPSVGRVVDRMRDAFLGQAPVDGLLIAELRLSRREASDGLVVPIEVPIRGTCPRCGGRGESWGEPCEPCSRTGESLFRHAVRVTVPAGIADGATLRFRVSSPHAEAVRVEVKVAIEPSLV